MGAEQILPALAALLVLETLLIVVLLSRRRRLDLAGRLKRTEDLYQSVIETQTDLICRYLPDTTLTFVNDAYCRYFERTREELLGSKFIDLIPEDERESTLQHIASLLERPRTVAYTHTVSRADSSVGWQQWVDHVIEGEDGRVSELQGIGRDITDLKLTEHELQKQRDQVAHLMRVATLGELSGALAHELNQPLAAILSNAQAGELLLETESPDIEQLREILADIVADDVRAGQVIRRMHGLLTRGEFRPQHLDVGELLGEVLALVHGPFLEQRINLVCDIPADLPPVLGDRVQLLQLMLNLLINASEATLGNGADDRDVRLSAAAGAADGVALAVSDNGCGFAPDVLERLFEPFFTTKDGGLGLGLCVARSIVEVHGGQIEAWENEERGATVAVQLPRADEAREKGAMAGAP